MRLRDHLIAAGLAVVVMALSLTVGGSDADSTPDGQADAITAAAAQP